MRYLLQIFQAWRLFRLGWPVFQQDDVLVKWSELDATNLRAFLLTPSGRKLSAAWRVKVHQIEGEAISQHEGDKYECGTARGWREAGSFMKSLSEWSAPFTNDNPEYDMAGAHDALETHAP